MKELIQVVKHSIQKLRDDLKVIINSLKDVKTLKSIEDVNKKNTNYVFVNLKLSEQILTELKKQTKLMEDYYGNSE